MQALQMENLNRYYDVTTERRRTAFIKADIAISLAEHEISNWKDQSQRSLDNLSKGEIIDYKADRDLNLTTHLTTNEIKDRKIERLEKLLKETKRRLRAARASEEASKFQLENVLKAKHAEDQNYHEQLSILETQMRKLEQKYARSNLQVERGLNSDEQMAVSKRRTYNISSKIRQDPSKAEVETFQTLNQHKAQLEEEIETLEAKHRALHSKNWADMRMFYEDRINILQESVRDWRQKYFALTKQPKLLLRDMKTTAARQQEALKEIQVNSLY